MKRITVSMLILLVLFVAPYSHGFVIGDPPALTTPSFEKYAPDPAAADQGATDTSAVTLKNLIDAIGTSMKATIIFHHSGAANTTTYTLKTSEVVPSNITLWFERGAIIADDANNATLKIYGPIDAGIYKIFDWGTGMGAVKFGNNAGGPIDIPAKISEVIPQWWGATGDNSTNDTAAVEHAIIAGNYTNIPIHFSAGTYRVTPGALTTVTCSIYGPDANIAAIDNTNSFLFDINYGATNSRLDLRQNMKLIKKRR